MSSKTSRIVIAASMWLATLSPIVPTVSADPNDLFAPVFVNRPQGALYFSHCDTARYTFQAVSSATGLPSPFVRYRIVSGPGTIDSVTGEWKYGPLTEAELFGSYQLEVAAREFNLETEGLQDCFANILIENRLAGIYFYDRPSVVFVAAGDTVELRAEIYEPDPCDSAHAYVEGVTPEFAGAAWFETENVYYRYFKIAPAISDTGKLLAVRLAATDEFDTVRTTLNIQVLPTPYYSVRIGTVTKQLQGMLTQIPIFIDRSIPRVGVGGFDLLIAYDNAALSFQAASPDSSGLYHQCEWEYFTYRFGANGNCSGGCPSGLVRVVGIAETNNGTHHPICPPENVPELPVEICRLEFLISNSSNFDCAFVPLKFFFVDCGDNTLSSADGKSLYLADSVFERGESVDGYSYKNVTDPHPILPTYFGAPSSCAMSSYKTPVVRGVCLYGGGVGIACSDSSGSPTDVIEDNPTLPLEFALHQNYPNPFNPSTAISFDLPHAADVKVDILNILGQVVWSKQERMAAGTQIIAWYGIRSDGSPVSSGVYYYRLIADDYTATKKMILMK